MIAARALLDEATAAGFTVECLGGRLHVKPTPPPDLIEQIRQHKAAIIELLDSPRRPAVDQMELARRSTKHPPPPGTPVCAKCNLLLCGEGHQRDDRRLYHPRCVIMTTPRRVALSAAPPQKVTTVTGQDEIRIDALELEVIWLREVLERMDERVHKQLQALAARSGMSNLDLAVAGYNRPEGDPVQQPRRLTRA